MKTGNFGVIGKDVQADGCWNCCHLKAYVSLWCTNREAIEWRGTSLPGVINCPFFKTIPPKPLSILKRILNYFNKPIWKIQ